MSEVRYLPELTLKINDKDASKALLADILQISVEESLHLPGMFTLIINNPYLPGLTEDQTWQHEDLLVMGASIKIGFKSSTTEASEFTKSSEEIIFEGEITGIETHFTSDAQAPLVIRGYDVAHRLHRGRYNRSFQNMTDNDIVSQIANEVGIATNTISSTGSPHDYVFQENQTNMEFLRERAARNGFEFFVQDGKLNFRAPTSGNTLNLVWLKGLSSFRVRVSSAEQVSSVEVRGWDYTQKRAIIASKNSAQVLTTTEHGSGRSTSSSFNPSTPKMVVVDQPVFSSGEADKIAQSLLNELGGEFVHADARAEGNPNIRPGKVLNLSGMGKYSGTYYITETRHLFYKGDYTTEFSVRGLRGGDLLSTLSPPTRLQAGQTLLVGKVTNNKDPKSWGRVRVKFPTLTEEHESNWARVVAIGAGSGRGFDCLPEIDDEVLVAFEHGDIHRPYIIGGVWNGKDAPPEAVNNSVVEGAQAGQSVRLRTFKTSTGHKLQFVETDKDSSKKGAYLETVYGHKLDLNDSDKFAELKTTGKHQVRLDDKDGQKKIQVKSGGNHEVLLDDNTSAKIIKVTSAGDIKLQAATGKKITLNAQTIELLGGQTITLKVGMNTIEVTQSGITLKVGGNTIDVKQSGITINSQVTTTVKGAIVTVNATGIVTVSGASISLG